MTGNGKRKLSRAELAQRQEAPLQHGAYSPTQIKAKARSHRVRFLRRAGLKAGDLDAIAAELLRHWARGAAQLDLLDAAGVDTGREYWLAYNATRRAFEKLEARLKELGLDRGPDKAQDLAGYVAERYGAGS